MRPSKLLATPEGRFIKSVADFDDVIGRVEILSRRINGIYKVIFVHSDINTYNELCKACKKLSRLLNDAIDKMRKVKKDNIAILDCVAQVLPEINIPILDINKDKGSPFTTN